MNSLLTLCPLRFAIRRRIPCLMSIAPGRAWAPRKYWNKMRSECWPFCDFPLWSTGSQIVRRFIYTPKQWMDHGDALTWFCGNLQRPGGIWCRSKYRWKHGHLLSSEIFGWPLDENDHKTPAGWGVIWDIFIDNPPSKKPSQQLRVPPNLFKRRALIRCWPQTGFRCQKSIDVRFRVQVSEH